VVNLSRLSFREFHVPLKQKKKGFKGSKFKPQHAPKIVQKCGKISFKNITYSMQSFYKLGVAFNCHIPLPPTQKLATFPPIQYICPGHSFRNAWDVRSTLIRCIFKIVLVVAPVLFQEFFHSSENTVGSGLWVIIPQPAWHILSNLERGHLKYK
jgi:hypothetical protein